MREARIRKFEDISPSEALLVRQKMGIGRFRKTRSRDPEKADLLLKLNLNRIRKAEENDFIPIGYRRRKLRLRAIP